MKKLALLVVIIILAIVAGLVWSSDPASAPRQHEAPKTKVEHHSKVSHVFDKTKYSLSSPVSPWVVVNKRRPLEPKTYAPADLTVVGHGQQLRASAASALEAMEASAEKEGVSFYAASGYRSYQQQVATYSSEVKAFGQAQADRESARPGFSEHQTGWAVDLGTGDCRISDCFADTPAGHWLDSNAYKFGFILRYPDGKDAVTGYRYEPWHYRYVGKPLAGQMHKLGVTTLEKFFDLSPAPDY